MVKSGGIEVPIHVTVSNPDVKTLMDYLPKTGYYRVKEIETFEAKDIHRRMMTVIRRLMTLWVDKINGYGTSRYDNHELDFDVWMNFSGVWRKYVRLEQLTRKAAAGDKEAIGQLIDAYGDMALYSISAVVVLEERL